jgi:flagellar hook protein FlgE
MSFTFSTALSGLRSSSSALGVTGNNIANANTTAFKGSKITFADVFTSSVGVRFNGAGTGIQIGNGVTTAATNMNFSQGTMADSSAPTNAAIQGNGFFVVENVEGAQFYTRAGDFALDKNGNLVTSAGHLVQGYMAINGAFVPGTPLSEINVPIGQMVAPVSTTQVTMRMNLDSTAATTSEFHAPVQVYDSLGVGRSLDVIFTKQAGNGLYAATATLDGAAATVNGGASANFTFDANGMLVSPATLTIVPDATQLDGATLPSINMNLFQTNPDGTVGAPNLTNFAAPSAVASTEQNGFAAGSLVGLSLAGDNSGRLSAVFNNGQMRPIAVLALATFNAQTGLRRLGNNLYAETLTSGPPSIGIPASGGRGEVLGSSLEQSNVDIATEFTDLIVAQRSFQANARVVTTISQTLENLLQIA